jgi:acetyltransferase-like isoleucine patch superfamily enzyme
MGNEIREEPKTELQMQLTDQKLSSLQKYQAMVIGEPGFWKMIKYELILMICNACPGALGFTLRKLLYPLIFAKVGRGTIFGRNMTIRHPSKIRIGDRCVIDDLVVLDAKGESNRGIIIGNDVILARNTVLSCKGGDIEIDDFSNISLNCMVVSEKSVKIGKNNLWAAYCYIIGGGRHDFERTDLPIMQQGSQVDGIVMEDDIWLGADVKILDGCRIGKGVIIGAGSLVNKDIPAYKIAAGSPAKIIKDRSNGSNGKTTGREPDSMP